MVKKCRGGNLPIDATVEARLNMNIEFEFWASLFQNELNTKICWLRSCIIAIKRIEEQKMRPLIFDVRYPIERLKIKQIVGEIY